MDNSLLNLKGLNALILGSSSFLAAPVIQAFSDQGMELILIDRNAGKLQKQKNLYPGSQTWQGDILDKYSIQKVSEEIADKNNMIDVLINFIGGNTPEATSGNDRSFFDLRSEDIEKTVHLNLFGGAVNSLLHFGPLLTKNPNGGSVIHISSMNAFRPLTNIAGYSMAKAAVENFTKWAAADMMRNHNRKLRVNSIAPGFYITDQNRYLLLNEDGSYTERAKAILEHTPAGRFGEPEDLVSAVLFLASPDSVFVSGICVPVDGGFSAFSGV